MSDVEEEVVNNEAPVASEAAEEVEAPVASEAAEEVEAPVASEAAEAPVESESVEEPVEAEEEDPAEESEEPVEEAAEAAEAPVASEAVEEPVEEAPSPEPEEEALVEEEAPVASDAVAPVPVEQVASDIREILAPVSVENAVSSDVSETDNICSLKTLINVLGKWSGGEIRKRQVEDLLKEGSEVDDNLDDLEKVVEVLQLWIQEGGSTFREHNYFKNLDDYTLVGESRNLSEEKKVEVLKTLTELVVNVSQRKVINGGIQNVMNNLY